jgi:hypothetical protein
MEAKVKAGLWAQMAIRLADIAGRSAMVLRKGDPDSGGILCLLRADRDRCTVLAQVRDGEGRPAWMRGTGATPVPEPEAEAYIARQVQRDPDLWVLEFESPDLVPPFEAKLI